MAAPTKDIVSMADTEKHRTSSERIFEHESQRRFADVGQNASKKIVSEDCSEYVNARMRELLGEE